MSDRLICRILFIFNYTDKIVNQCYIDQIFQHKIEPISTNFWEQNKPTVLPYLFLHKGEGKILTNLAQGIMTW